MKEHVFHRLAKKNFFQEWWAYNFIKTAKIFLKMMQFFTKYTYSVGFSFMWSKMFSSIEWSEKNIEILKIEKMATVFLKILKMDFLERATFKICFFFFGGLSIIWTTYSPSLASGKQFLPIRKKNFRKQSKLLMFSKTTEETSKY